MLNLSLIALSILLIGNLAILTYAAHTSESVKLAAVKDILDRAGLKPVDKVEHIEQISTSELQQELATLLEEPVEIGTKH